MTDESQIPARTCRKCSSSADFDPELRFCPQCGADLEETDQADLPVENEAVQPVSTLCEPALAEKLEQVSARDDTVIMKHVKIPSGGMEVSGRRSESAGIQLDSGSSMASDCEHLDVLYNNGRVFVEGMIFPFEFRITPKAPDIENLFLEIRTLGKVITRGEPCEYLVPGREIRVDLGFNVWSGLHGKVPFHIWIGYMIGGKQYHFIARRTHKCFKRKARMQTVLKELKIELHNQSNTGHASDPHVHQQINGLDKLISHPDDPAEDFRHVDIPDFWGTLVMHRGRYTLAQGSKRCPPAGIPSSEALCDMLSIVAGDKRIHLLAGSAVQLGRKRCCDIVTRVFDWSGRDDPSLLVSRLHCIVESSHDGWELKPASEAGRIFIDKKPLAPSAVHVIQPDTPFVFSFAYPDCDKREVVSFDTRLWSCQALSKFAENCAAYNGAENGVAALVLARRHDPCEIFVILQRFMPLELVLPECSGICVCRCGNAFVFSSPGSCEWLVPGKSFLCSGLLLDVIPYRQINL